MAGENFNPFNILDAQPRIVTHMLKYEQQSNLPHSPIPVEKLIEIDQLVLSLICFHTILTKDVSHDAYIFTTYY